MTAKIQFQDQHLGFSRSFPGHLPRATSPDLIPDRLDQDLDYPPELSILAKKTEGLASGADSKRKRFAANDDIRKLGKDLIQCYTAGLAATVIAYAFGQFNLGSALVFFAGSTSMFLSVSYCFYRNRRSG